MLLSKIVSLKWNSKIKKHYEELGYKYTKMGDLFEVDVNDLTSGSNVLVDVECDYCHRIYQTQWYIYNKSKKGLIKKDCCNNPECTGKKSQETIQQKYHVSNIMEISEVNDKIAKTNMERYGSENPFGSKEIMEKIKETNLEKYGVEWYTKTDEFKERYKQTCLEKYGVLNYSYTDTFIKMMSGENNPAWKGNNIKIPRDWYRNSSEYRNWRNSVFNRDNYTCQCCGSHSGNGKAVKLAAHHIQNWTSCITLRYDKENGITLCDDCHMSFHSIYGIKNNNLEQLNEFIYLNNKGKLDEKIC